MIKRLRTSPTGCGATAEEPQDPEEQPEPPAQEAEMGPEQQSPGMQAAQCILDGDHAGARLALESVTEPGAVDETCHDDAQALEDSFAAAEAEARPGIYSLKFEGTLKMNLCKRIILLCPCPVSVMSVHPTVIRKQF